MRNIKIINGPSNEELFDSLRFCDNNIVQFVIKTKDNKKEKIGVNIIGIEVARLKNGDLDEDEYLILNDQELLPHLRYMWAIKMFIKTIPHHAKFFDIPADNWTICTANYSTKTKKGILILPEEPKKHF